MSLDKKSEEKIRMMELENFSRLSEHACKNEEAERFKSIDKDLRLEFQRDIDKITYSDSYTRYMGKTQVYTLRNEDHISKRSVHVQYVSRVARTIARALSLNEDLCEAMALGHDIGHVPFGHLGERFLNELSLKYTGKIFAHNVQSMRQLQFVEEKGKGLNLTCQVLDGVLCHNGELLHKEYKPKYDKTKDELIKEYENCYESIENIKKLVPMTLEGCIVRISDVIAYIGKDIEDAITLGVITRNDIPKEITDVLGNTNSNIIDSIISDIIENSLGKEYISMSDKVYSVLQSALKFNYEKIYNKAYTDEEIKNYKKMFDELFLVYLKALSDNDIENDIISMYYSEMSEEYKENTPKERVVIDYIAGMTDRYICYQYDKYIKNKV